jgi:hypothetical protein
MDRRRRTRVIPILASCLLAVSCQHAAAAEERLGVFRSFPGVRRLCSSSVLGSDGARQVEINFTLYSSSHEPSEVTRFYADAYGLPWKRGQDSISVRPKDGPNVLSVSPASSEHPECGVKPSSTDRTLVVVSIMLARTP